jgi:hypothetical protein
MEIPDRVGTVRVRILGDGSFFISRRDKEVEKYLDKHFHRLGREPRWALGSGNNKSIAELEPLFAGKTVYLVGKGPSLDHLTADMFGNEDSPIICINEAIHAVDKLNVKNPTFAIQQDAGLKDTCQPKRGNLLVGNSARHFNGEFERKYVFNAKVYVEKNELTVCVAIEIAKALCATGFVMYCFDGCTVGNTGYSSIVSYPPTAGGDPKRFLDHKRRILARIGERQVTWITPEVPVEASPYTPLPLQDSPEEHHDDQTQC